jgi:alkanesulfonate monooxygenase SsuD/methylene tetrahydromethanopterin reductase-like flavin-dependent oxidoreductase (luciferase family)
VFQQFATLDNLSEGRAEIMAGRGSFIESFPLFGYDLDDYDTLFSEKLALLMRLNEGETVTWPGGDHTPAIAGRGVYPRPFGARLPVWIAVGGTPNSVARAGMLGLPLALAIIGGEPARFAPLFDLYRQAAARSGHDAARLRTSLNVHGFVAETGQEAAESFYAPQAEVMNRIGRERGWGPTSRAQFDAARGPRGALFVGSPAEVTDKILAAHEVFGFDRFLIQMAIGVIDHGRLMKAIELLGTRVAPELRKAVAGPVAGGAARAG